eukprot:357736-Chlamydomonas_euryale.AAC.3
MDGAMRADGGGAHDGYPCAMQRGVAKARRPPRQGIRPKLREGFGTEHARGHGTNAYWTAAAGVAYVAALRRHGARRARTQTSRGGSKRGAECQ